MNPNSAIDRVLARRKTNELVNRLRTSLEEQERKNGQEALCSAGEQGISRQLGLLPVEESRSETKSPCSHQNEQVFHSPDDHWNDLLGYGQFLCDLSRGSEAKLGIKVDPRLEKKFVQAYHSGQASSLLHAWMRMMGELWKRGKAQQ